MKIENKMDVLEDDIANTHSSNTGKEEGSISKDVGGLGWGQILECIYFTYFPLDWMLRSFKSILIKTLSRVTPC